MSCAEEMPGFYKSLVNCIGLWGRFVKHLEGSHSKPVSNNQRIMTQVRKLLWKLQRGGWSTTQLRPIGCTYPCWEPLFARENVTLML